MSTAVSNSDLVGRLPVPVRQDWADLAVPTQPQPLFDPASVADVPEPARRWLTHAIAVGTPLRRRVELDQHGEIHIGAWRRFRAKQIIAPLDGYVWAVATHMFGVPIYGYDRLAHGAGEMAHRAFGRFPIVSASGTDLTRSAAGRLLSEMVWAPAVAVGPEVRWKPVDEHTAIALLPYGGETYEVSITAGSSGALEKVTTDRWASIEKGPYGLHPFGAEIHSEATFGGYTVPSEVTAGYDHDSERWPDCAFIKLVIDDATYL